MSKYSYRVAAEYTHDGFTEHFNHLFFALLVARTSLKAGMKVTITRERGE